MRKKAILITALGSFSADSVLRSLNKEFRLCGTDINEKECIAVSNDVESFYKISKAISPTYMEEIKSICDKEEISYLIPLTDIEIDVLNENRKWFKEHNVELLISPYDTIKLTRNKIESSKFVSELNNSGLINSIPTVPFSYDLEISFDFPIVAKLVNGRSSEGLYIIESEKKWENVKPNLNENYILQPYIGGKVIAADVLVNPMESESVAVIREELTRTVNGAGISVRVYRDGELEKSCIKLAKEMGIIGCVNFEFIKDKHGNYHFLECNPRFSGGISFSCATGYDLVRNHLRCFSGENINPYTFRDTLYIARKYEDYITKRI